MGKSLSYERVDIIHKDTWKKDSTIQNITINSPKQSMKAALLLFREKGETNPEKFIFPDITSVKVTIEGIPNMIYSQGMPARRMFAESQRIFECCMADLELLPKDFFTDCFALFIDLRTTQAMEVTGKKLVQTQHGILLEITKKATAKDLTCYVFTLCDALINIRGGDFHSVTY